MQIEVSALGVDVTEALRAYTENRIRTSLRGFFGRISRILVGFNSVTHVSSRSAVECRIRVEIIGRRNHTEAFSAAEVYRSVDGAAERLSRSLPDRMENLCES